MGSTWGRMSFILLMLQLFGTNKWRRRALWALFWTQFIANGVVVVTLYVQCDDVTSLWNFTNPGKCWDESVQTVSLFLSTLA